MFYQSDVVYRYDGSFEGLLCCVFESYAAKEIPEAILLPEAPGALLFCEKVIATEPEKAQRVLHSIPQKLGKEALLFVQQAFFTCLPDKERHILLFLRLGYQQGPMVMHLLTHDTVDTLCKAVRHLERESHLFKGFVRFAVANGVLVAEIEPKNFVLPFLVQHFCERFPEERFLIFDQTHGAALVYQPYEARIMPLDSLELPEPDAEEAAYQALWQAFYETIAIKGRENPRCRMTHMPKRYWKYLTEFVKPGKGGRRIRPAGAAVLPDGVRLLPDGKLK